MIEESDDKPATPSLGELGQARAKQREIRRASALRANLSRRKSQSRVRDGKGGPSEPEDGAGDPMA